MRSIHFKAMMAGLALIGWAAGINNGRAQIIPKAFELITFTNTWHYNPSGTDLHAMIPLGTDWRAPGYNDTDPTLGWDSGGMGPNNGLPLFGFETTPLEYAYVFNTHFADPAPGGARLVHPADHLRVSLLDTDGDGPPAHVSRRASAGQHRLRQQSADELCL